VKLRKLVVLTNLTKPDPRISDDQVVARPIASGVHISRRVMLGLCGFAPSYNRNDDWEVESRPPTQRGRSPR
jgi:hypothetical protein